MEDDVLHWTLYFNGHKWTIDENTYGEITGRFNAMGESGQFVGFGFDVPNGEGHDLLYWTPGAPIHFSPRD